ncbi:probable serine/threonine-protein kinase DDB_G0282963 [Condylostylus longicornis]|uniref:probable serine/threonine-protein kinase DDB_G0282963 n=1 Tax=Condylostylus longicornis TaxID=2530218 RepID=UPI00244E48CA|nr:probable serine/threonine-protein kinase DDB_G0282963 [Condylostylus longicornis]XP_055385510.1 probable serine/threonine-protein kinase DDB_G0282963 [Condylostylus longicornis]XP_055385511.1 probable serine/threonine-protein kinase DDB_G0282963 [Condylostylus longicornis]XP_055385512.1 probable serine/threonine-protein kinase DDB_G0282963 [Condylostylus longicornis]
MNATSTGTTIKDDQIKNEIENNEEILLNLFKINRKSHRVLLDSKRIIWKKKEKDDNGENNEIPICDIIAVSHSIEKHFVKCLRKNNSNTNYDNNSTSRNNNIVNISENAETNLLDDNNKTQLNKEILQNNTRNTNNIISNNTDITKSSNLAEVSSSKTGPTTTEITKVPNKIKLNQPSTSTINNTLLTSSTEITNITTITPHNNSNYTNDNNYNSKYLIINYAKRLKNSKKNYNKWYCKTVTLYNNNTNIIIKWYNTINNLLKKLKHPKNILLFINPYGGKKNGIKIYNNICKPLFKLANINIILIISQKSKQIYDIIMEQSINQYDAICCIGGDGTISELFNGLIYRAMKDLHININKPEYIPKPKIPIGIIPGGSTNTIVYSLHGTCDIITSTIHIILGQKRGLDLASVYNINGLIKFYASVISYGYLGDIALDSENYRWMGPKRYDYSGIKKFFKNHGYYGDITFLTSDIQVNENVSKNFQNEVTEKTIFNHNDDNNDNENNIEKIEENSIQNDKPNTELINNKNDFKNSNYNNILYDNEISTTKCYVNCLKCTNSLINLLSSTSSSSSPSSSSPELLSSSMTETKQLQHQKYKQSNSTIQGTNNTITNQLNINNELNDNINCDNNIIISKLNSNTDNNNIENQKINNVNNNDNFFNEILFNLLSNTENDTILNENEFNNINYINDNNCDNDINNKNKIYNNKGYVNDNNENEEVEKEENIILNNDKSDNNFNSNKNKKTQEQKEDEKHELKQEKLQISSTSSSSISTLPSSTMLSTAIVSKTASTSVSITTQLMESPSSPSSTSINNKKSTMKLNGKKLYLNNIKGNFFLISCANISCLCDRSPNGWSQFSHLGDGYLDIILVRHTTFLNNLKLLMAMTKKNGNINNLPFVKLYRTKKFLFRAKKRDPINRNSIKTSQWNCDGEVVHDTDLIISSHCQLIDVFMRGPYPKETSDERTVKCCEF